MWKPIIQAYNTHIKRMITRHNHPSLRIRQEGSSNTAQHLAALEHIQRLIGQGFHALCCLTGFSFGLALGFTLDAKSDDHFDDDVTYAWASSTVVDPGNAHPYCTCIHTFSIQMIIPNLSRVRN